MTEDELIFASAAVEGEISDTVKTVSKAEQHLASLNQYIVRKELIIKSVLDALQNLKETPVVMMSEHKSLVTALKGSRVELEDLLQKRFQATQVRNKALAALPKLRKQLQTLEHQLDNFEPPRTVLEFRRDQQRSP